MSASLQNLTAIPEILLAVLEGDINRYNVRRKNISMQMDSILEYSGI